MACPPISAVPGNTLYVTSTTRPAGNDRFTGQSIYELDTLRSLQFDGTGWTILSEPNQTWVPSFAGGVTVGGGVWTSAFYHRSDGWLDISGIFTLDGTSAITGSVTLNLPVAALGATFGRLRVEFVDTSAGFVFPGYTNGSLTAPTLLTQLASGTYVQGTTLSALIPFTWATTDVISVFGRYPMTTRYS